MIKTNEEIIKETIYLTKKYNTYCDLIDKLGRDGESDSTLAMLNQDATEIKKEALLRIQSLFNLDKCESSRLFHNEAFISLLNMADNK